MSEIEQEVVVAEADAEGGAEEVTPEAELSETTDWQAEAKKARGIAQRLRTKLTKATEKKVVAEAPKEPVKKEEAPKTGELDETSVLWLEVKGVKTEDADEMKLVENWRKDSGKDVKSIWASRIFQAELKDLRAEREVQNAMPGSTKRANAGGAPNLQAAIAKFEATGELPADFKLRSEVVNATVDKQNTNKPSWH